MYWQIVGIEIEISQAKKQAGRHPKISTLLYLEWFDHLIHFEQTAYFQLIINLENVPIIRVSGLLSRLNYLGLVSTHILRTLPLLFRVLQFCPQYTSMFPSLPSSLSVSGSLALPRQILTFPAKVLARPRAMRSSRDWKARLRTPRMMRPPRVAQF